MEEVAPEPEASQDTEPVDGALNGLREIPRRRVGGRRRAADRVGALAYGAK